MDVAELIDDGDFQVVRLPRGYRLDGRRVFVKRLGNALALIPEQESWQPLIDGLTQFSDDFMADREQPPAQRREQVT